MMKLWKRKIPMKIKIFMWFAFQDRIQSGGGGTGMEIQIMLEI
jgi:hypothetical protein